MDFSCELMSSNETTRIRKKAAKALVILYKSGRLTKKQKQKILALRSAIDSSHTDFARSHWDKPATGHEDRSHGSKLDTGCSGMYHTDIDRKHEDIPGQMHQDVVKKGLGVHFPL